MKERNSTITIDLGRRSYDVHVGPGLLDSLGDTIRPHSDASRITIVTDQNVARHYSIRAVESLEAAGFATKTITIPPGESSKSLSMAARLYDGLAERKRGRNDPIVALGGGVVGDLAGFVAATWMRGVPFIQCPTSTEAMIDAGVGGKTAVNHESGKNLIGAFHQPIAVVIDTDTVATLERRDYFAGLAESIKHALISDSDLLAWHQANRSHLVDRDPTTLTELVIRNCRIKADVVQADEREESVDEPGRAVLNFGHTVGHALETLSAGALRHGEAVSIGMTAELAMSVRHLGFPRALAQTAESLLLELQLPVNTAIRLEPADIYASMLGDKKNRSSDIRFVLLRDRGDPAWYSVRSLDQVSDELCDIIGR